MTSGRKIRNTSAFDDCDLVPNVLAGVSEIDMGVTVMGKHIAMPLDAVADGVAAALPLAR